MTILLAYLLFFVFFILPAFVIGMLVGRALRKARVERETLFPPLARWDSPALKTFMVREPDHVRFGMERPFA